MNKHFKFGKTPFKYEVLVVFKRPGDVCLVDRQTIVSYYDVLDFFKENKTILSIINVYKWTINKNKVVKYKKVKIDKNIKNLLCKQNLKRLKLLNIY